MERYADPQVPHSCVGCGRNLQRRGGRAPHPSERLCGWCRQRIAVEAKRRRLLTVIAHEAAAASGTSPRRAGIAAESA